VSTPDPKGAGGRIGVPSRGYGGVVVEGTAGSATVSGLDFVQRLGVSRRSERFAVVTGVGGGGSGPGSDPECAPTTDQSGNTVVTRSSGPGRVETAVAVSRDHWQTASDVVLATAGRFPDALAAGALAARLDAPVLLTSESELSPQVAEEIARLGATTAHVLGGSGAVGPRATEALAQRGVAVRRLAGPSRFETAAAAALAAGSSPSGDVALAFGGDWPDAVSAGALSASADRIPTLLTARDALPSATRAALAELDAQRVLIVGGSAVISEGVAAQLRELGYSVARIAGANRWETSLAAVRDGLSRGTPGGRPVILASGAAFPDALSAGGLAARRNGGLLLVPRCDLNQTTATRDYLDDAGFGGGTIVGGTAAVSDRVREQAANLLRR
jgi:putative cell wall-binding protein